MKAPNLKAPKIERLRNWFRARRRWHDPMLVFNMSVFNSGNGWSRIFNSVAARENVW
jgi:hypothetical protein